MGARGAGGDTSRGPARLQPGLGWSPQTSRISPVVGDALLELLHPALDDDERAELKIDAEQLQRRWADMLQYEQLRQIGFEGYRYEMFAADLAAYGYPVISSWVRRGLIFQYCAERGRPVRISARDREHLCTPGRDNDGADDRRELALETNARALRFFRQHVLLTGAWSVEKGASLSTFYVGACLFAFPNVFQRWAAERARHVPVAPAGMHPPEEQQVWTPYGNAIDIDPAVSAVSAIAVTSELQAMPERTRKVAELLVNEGASFAEIGEQLGMTDRAVEGLLYRYRTEAKRRKLHRRLA
jgi:DNA-directed RNA polymerase specialized sigma24 family protein